MAERSLENILYFESKKGLQDLGLTFAENRETPLKAIDPDLQVIHKEEGDRSIPTLAKAVDTAAWHAHNISHARDIDPDQYGEKKPMWEFRLEENVADVVDQVQRIHPEMKEPAETVLAYVKALASIAVARQELTFEDQLEKFKDDPGLDYRKGHQI